MQPKAKKKRGQSVNLPTAKGIFCSDLHLCSKPPIWRSSEDDWFEAMARPLRQLKALQEKYNTNVYCCGDIFDRWNAAPEVINFALDMLPTGMIAIPGQHDLPNHNIHQWERSAFGSLLKAGKIRCPYDFESFRTEPIYSPKTYVSCFGFPYGEELSTKDVFDEDEDEDEVTVIALCHEYTWMGDFKHDKAQEEDKLNWIKDKYRWWDAIFCGDNHKPFRDQKPKSNTLFVNCGSLMKRRAEDESNHPCLWVMNNNDDPVTISCELIDTSEDKYLPITKEEEKKLEHMDLSELIGELESLDSDHTDITQILERELHRGKYRSAVINIIKRCADDNYDKR